MGHTDSVRLHGVPLPIVIVADLGCFNVKRETREWHRLVKAGDSGVFPFCPKYHDTDALKQTTSNITYSTAVNEALQDTQSHADTRWTSSEHLGAWMDFSGIFFLSNWTLLLLLTVLRWTNYPALATTLYYTVSRVLAKATLVFIDSKSLHLLVTGLRHIQPLSMAALWQGRITAGIVQSCPRRIFCAAGFYSRLANIKIQ